MTDLNKKINKRLNNKSKAALLTIATFASILILLTLLFTYPADFIAWVLVIILFGALGFSVYITYKFSLSVVEKYERRRK